jgi:hypothetical protein
VFNILFKTGNLPINGGNVVSVDAVHLDAGRSEILCELLRVLAHLPRVRQLHISGGKIIINNMQKTHPVWCSGQKKRAPLSFFHGYLKKRLRATTKSTNQPANSSHN